VGEPGHSSSPFATVSMAEILLAQDLWKEAAEVVEVLAARELVDPRLHELKRRIEQRSLRGELEQRPVDAAGRDRIALALTDAGLGLTWELTDAGLALARRSVRYSGVTIVRLFTAVAGPRGVRTGTRDIEVELPAGELDLLGVPSSAVYVAAAGYLGRNGVFAPLARSETVGGTVGSAP
jgi:hypothetical protein